MARGYVKTNVQFNSVGRLLRGCQAARRKGAVWNLFPQSLHSQQVTYWSSSNFSFIFFHTRNIKYPGGVSTDGKKWGIEHMSFTTWTICSYFGSSITRNLFGEHLSYAMEPSDGITYNLRYTMILLTALVYNEAIDIERVCAGTCSDLKYAPVFR